MRSLPQFARVGADQGIQYDQFRVRDFALGPERISRIDLPGGLLLGYLYRPCTAHTGWVRVIYYW